MFILGFSKFWLLPPLTTNDSSGKFQIVKLLPKVDLTLRTLTTSREGADKEIDKFMMPKICLHLTVKVTERKKRGF